MPVRRLTCLTTEGLITDGIVTRAGHPTGTATILWEQPESTIIINAGANGTVDEQLVERNVALVRDAEVVLCQCETPLDALRAVVDNAVRLKILNPASAMPVPREIRDGFDLLIPNRFELATLAGAETAPRTPGDVVALAQKLEFPGTVVVTLGEDGSIVVPPGADDVIHVPAMSVDAVDSTAAGDSFCAALADGLLRGESIADAATWAARVADTRSPVTAQSSPCHTRKISPQSEPKDLGPAPPSLVAPTNA